MEEIRERLHAMAFNLKLAVEMARVSEPKGTVKLAIILKNEDGSGTMGASFDANEFLKDLEAFTTPPKT